ncbi:hypothetical protein Hokovirus_1_344 [Hokovirus HKV1]|uniref:AAA domain protein n=1 Tax=Hokovirus HKV1 TaxID=1977638 RepID=A0A1V0SFH0_9VIRU|nr:hypothetical protein Hokovirus_1_344 [Hokovirus HKV1]
MSYKIIIIIGLPCSGKTYLSNTFDDYLILDDYYCNYYTMHLKNFILNNPKIIINDPRLCYKNVFEDFINEVKKYVVDKEIFVILFENNVNQCLINENKRMSNKKNIIQEIKNFSLSYDIEKIIEILNDIKYEICKVYE